MLRPQAQCCCCCCRQAIASPQPPLLCAGGSPGSGSVAGLAVGVVLAILLGVLGAVVAVRCLKRRRAASGDGAEASISQGFDNITFREVRRPLGLAASLDWGGAPSMLGGTGLSRSCPALPPRLAPKAVLNRGAACRSWP